MKKKSIISYIPAVLSLLLALGTAFVFKACPAKEDGTWMHCHTAQNTVVLCAAVLCVIFLVAALAAGKTVRLILGLIGALGSLIVFFIPGKIVSMCMMTTMHCYSVMQPFVRIMSVLVIVAELIRIVSDRRAS